jgi:DNA polymerase V
MMSLAAGLGPAQEIYSIDESFIDLTGVRGNLVERSCVRPHSSVGRHSPAALALHPKTLAKLANHVAKTAERKPGIYPTS